MLYIERNKIITAEIAAGVKINSGGMVGERSLNGTETRIAGSYYSSLLNQELYLALKIPGRRGNISFNWVYTMAAHAALYDEIPRLQPELPAFLTLVQNNRGEDIGFLTEDFSQGGRYGVVELTEPEAPKLADVSAEIRALFRGESSMELLDEDLVNMFFWVRTEKVDQRRMGDLDRAMMYLNYTERSERFRVDELFQAQAAYTLSLD